MDDDNDQDDPGQLRCDACGEPVTDDDEFQQTPDAVVCGPCCRRLVRRAAETARARVEAEGRKESAP
jgi:formylmethanofuran dehydrogenase subunit E